MAVKIIIFTNYDSLWSVNSDLYDRCGIPLIENNNFIGFNESAGEFEVIHNIAGEHRIYFVKDTVAENEFNEFVGRYDKEQAYILRHRLPNIDLNGFSAGNILRGAHTSTGPFYDQVLRIVVDASSDKLKRLFSALFTHDHVLESKLELLDKVLSSDKSLAEIINIIKDDKADKVRRIYAPRFTEDPDLGKRIIQSKMIYNGAEVSLEEKVLITQNEFRALAAFDETDTFATEYQTAFDKLRDLLGVD